jgi:hypothetical protein
MEINMPSNRRKRTPRSRKASGAGAALPQMPSPLMQERVMANIHRLLAEQEFETMEDMQAFLDQVVAAGQPIEVPPATDLERAQELVYEAYEAKQRCKRVRLAREALEISPDCADAYVLLAEEARSIDEARDFYAQGVQAGERALGPDEFEESVGMFWGMHETRGYMRAREGLATTLWGTDERAARPSDISRRCCA